MVDDGMKIVDVDGGWGGLTGERREELRFFSLGKSCVKIGL